MKFIKVNSCLDCPFFRDGIDFMTCGQSLRHYKIIQDKNIIQEWCPLQEYPKSLEKAEEIMRVYDVPSDIEPDWINTNHFEIHSAKSEEGWFWFDLDDYSCTGILPNDCKFNTESGKRIGAIMELACLVPKILQELDNSEKTGD